jgi:hypothetical protein
MFRNFLGRVNHQVMWHGASECVYLQVDMSAHELSTKCLCTTLGNVLQGISGTIGRGGGYCGPIRRLARQKAWMG